MVREHWSRVKISRTDCLKLTVKINISHAKYLIIYDESLKRERVKHYRQEKTLNHRRFEKYIANYMLTEKKQCAIDFMNIFKNQLYYTYYSYYKSSSN